ncbi:jg17170 [Pararge aegeria aegeria]|uniref:Jg17170 protein n=1 Tax=Pararge aegeria aegeria TaxID=348720 RepID=A0A8S4RME0_9NEOP|nr:jg17170 [Pararge aegeria aegeria]
MVHNYCKAQVVKTPKEDAEPQSGHVDDKMDAKKAERKTDYLQDWKAEIVEEGSESEIPMEKNGRGVQYP